GMPKRVPDDPLGGGAPRPAVVLSRPRDAARLFHGGSEGTSVHFGVRFHLRNPPPWGRPWGRYYAGVLDLGEWGGAHAVDQFTLAEHHFVEDGYCPSPLTVAAAVAARTRRMRIILNLVVLPFRHPVQLAEEAALVDILSGGRLSLVVGAGYRQSEFDAYGI